MTNTTTPGFIAVVMACGMAYPDATWALGNQFEVDDAALVEAGQCEIENWYTRGGGDREITVMPVCNVTGNLELAVGLTRASPGDYSVALEAKTLIRSMGTNSLGWGLMLASTHSEGLAHWEGATVNIPVSVPVLEPLSVHTNIGWEYVREGRDLATWGLSGEFDVRNDWDAIVESWGTHRGGTLWQVGLRFSFGEGHWDVSYGSELKSIGDGWLALGFAWTI